MAKFLINGVAITGLSKDPIMTPGRRDSYGVRGSGRRMYGPYREWTATFAAMTDAELTALITQVNSANGDRRSVTVPYGSSSAWQTQSADLEIGEFTRDYRGYAKNVPLYLHRVSTT